jgi:hypothetical protein
MAFPVTRYRTTRTPNASHTGFTETMANAKTIYCYGIELHDDEMYATINELADVRVGDVLAVSRTIPG